MTYNRYMHDPKLRVQAGKKFIEQDSAINFDKADFVSRFTIEKLNECRDPFDQYIKSFGPTLPVNTRISWLNSLGNKAASKTHFIRTNQPYAAQVRKIMDEALEENERIKQKSKDNKKKFLQLKKEHPEQEIKNPYPIDLSAEETKIVIAALEKIKVIHNRMIEKRISGEVRKAIESTLSQFKVDICSNELIFKIPYTYKKHGQKEPITVIIQVKPQDVISKVFFKGERAYSPLVQERMLSRLY